MNTNLSRRSALSLALGGSALLALEGCSKDSSSASKSGSLGHGGVDLKTYDPMILAGPVASDDVIKANAWATKIKNAGVLRRGGAKTGAIFSLQDPTTGRITGFDAGIGDMLAHYILGGKDVSKLVKFSETSVDTRETMLENGTVDTVIATYTITEARAKKIAFAGPYYSSGTGIQVTAKNDSIKTVADLNGKKIATESNSTALTAIKKFVKNPQVTLFTDNDSCMAALSQGRVDAYVLDQAILLSNVVKDSSLKVVGHPFTSDPYGIGLPKNDPSAKAFVDDFLKKIYDSGDWAKLWKACIGPYEKDTAVPTPPKIGSVTGS